MCIINLIALILVIIGAVNWGLVGIFNWNVVDAIFGTGLPAGSIAVYCLIALAGLWLIFSACYHNGILRLTTNNTYEDKE